MYFDEAKKQNKRRKRVSLCVGLGSCLLTVSVTDRDEPLWIKVLSKSVQLISRVKKIYLKKKTVPEFSEENRLFFYLLVTTIV